MVGLINALSAVISTGMTGYKLIDIGRKFMVQLVERSVQ